MNDPDADDSFLDALVASNDADGARAAGFTAAWRESKLNTMELIKFAASSQPFLEYIQPAPEGGEAPGTPAPVLLRQLARRAQNVRKGSPDKFEGMAQGVYDVDDNMNTITDDIIKALAAHKWQQEPLHQTLTNMRKISHWHSRSACSANQHPHHASSSKTTTMSSSWIKQFDLPQKRLTITPALIAQIATATENRKIGSFHQFCETAGQRGFLHVHVGNDLLI